MKKVLLAVIGSNPNQKTYRYALQLSQQIHAELDVLQIERSRSGRNEDLNRVNPWKPDGVRFRRTACTGDPNTALIDYVQQNRDVVFTIYDAPSGGVLRKKKMVPKGIRKLPIPLIVMRD